MSARATVPYVLWLDPERGLLPVRHARVVLDSKHPANRIRFVVKDMDELRDRCGRALAERNLRVEDFVVVDGVAVPCVDVRFRGAKPVQSFVVFSTEKTREGVEYPKDMARFSPGAPVRDEVPKCFVTRLKVKSCELLGEDALADWDFPVGTYVADERTDSHYKAGISPETYMPVAKEQVAQVKAYQRGEVELPVMEVVPPAVPLGQGNRASAATKPDNRSAWFVGLGVALVVLTTCAVVLLRRRASV